MGVVVFLSCQLFGIRCPALELAGHWVELGLSVEMEISGRAFIHCLILCGAGRSLVDKSPELGSPTSEAQALHPARAPRPCLLHSSEKGRKKERKKERKERKKERIKLLK